MRNRPFFQSGTLYFAKTKIAVIAMVFVLPPNHWNFKKEKTVFHLETISWVLQDNLNKLNVGPCVWKSQILGSMCIQAWIVWTSLHFVEKSYCKSMDYQKRYSKLIPFSSVLSSDKIIWKLLMKYNFPLLPHWFDSLKTNYMERWTPIQYLGISHWIDFRGM